MRRAIRICICAIVFALALALRLGAAERVTMTVSPMQSFAPSDIVIQVHVIPDAANRSIVIVADSGDYYRSSMAQLDGENAPRMIGLELRRIPGGDYKIRAAVIDAAGHELGSVWKEALVIGRDSSQ
jgi:hypothetical protein